MGSQKVRKVKSWCPECDSAILTGTICPFCKTDINKYKKKNKDNFNRKPLRD
jgi:ribosomal protein L32